MGGTTIRPVDDRGCWPVPDAGWARAENAVTRRFLKRWADKPPNRLAELAAATKLPYTFGDRFLTRPVFLEAEQTRALARDIGALLDLLFSLPDRLFGGDYRAMASAVGLTAAQADAVARTATEQPVRLGRADLYDDGERFRLLEYNVSSAIGGWDAAELSRVLLRDDDLAAFVADEDARAPDTLALIADVIRAACAGRDVPSRPVVALVDWPSSFPTFGATLELMADGLSACGIDAVACHAGQLETRDGHLYVGGRHIDVFYRFVQMGDLLGDGALDLVEPVIAAHERGTVVLVSGFSAGVFASKGSLALLHDDDTRPLLSDAERELVDRALPWTKALRTGDTVVGGELVDLPEYVMANRADLVLKPTLLYGGSGVLPGWTTDQETWDVAVRAGLRGGVIVQERVRPAAERFPADDPDAESALQALNWGAFVTGDAYGGAFVRALPGQDAGIISRAAGAGIACCFHAQR